MQLSEIGCQSAFPQTKSSPFAAPLLIATGLQAQAPTPVGDQFQVKTDTRNAQGSADMAVDGSGNFVVVWESNGSAGTDPSEESIQAQRYSAGAEIVFGDGFESGDTTTWNSTVP